MSNSLQPLDCSPQGSSYHGIFQARIWEWVVIDFSRGFSWPRDQTHVSYIGRQIFFFSMVARIIFFFTSLLYFILFYFTILYWFCHTSTWIRHGCTRVPHPEPTPTSLTIPSLQVIPSAPAPSITALFIIAGTWKQPRCPSADEWIRKVWYIYRMEYYSATKMNIFESVLMRWKKLEPIIQREVSQKEKHQYSILTHIYGI